MSYQHHWVVVYDEDWGAFMVDAETTATMSRWSGTIYNKDSGHWEFPEEESDLANEYDSLEEILAYNLTRLDITKKVGQATHMTKNELVEEFRLFQQELEVDLKEKLDYPDPDSSLDFEEGYLAGFTYAIHRIMEKLND